MKNSIYEYRLQRRKVMEFKEGDAVSQPEKVFAFLKSINLDEEEQEHLIALILDVKNNIKAYYTITVGLIDSAPTHAREVFRNAILYGASGIILAHNHPSQNTDPSRTDIKITKEMADAGKIIGIELLDHIIIGKNYFSFAAKGML